MATYCPYLSNQAEVISSPYLRDQMYLPDQSLTTSYTSLLSTESLQCPPDGQRNEIEFISQMGNSPYFEQTEGEQNRTSQGLSLSLGTQFPPQIGMPVYQYQFAGPDSSHLLSPHVQVEYDFEAYKLLGPMPMIYNSKYMKVAQELLEEVVSVWKTIKQPETEKQKKVNKFELFQLKDVEMGSSSDACDSSTKGTSEFSPQGKKQLKEKLANLNSLVDEVDGRYRKYCHQMRTVVSSFELVAGHGAARSYTALALCTISRQFKCLRNAINEQILVIRQSLGEKDATPSVEGKLTRLRIVDQQLRQQMTLQQVGVMRNSGRPQRGLPGNSVSILRAWLFEHFLHPYPKDSEKIMLSRQTGLTRGQVANWFINARVRLWKPMVEEMYKEEFGNTDSSFSPDPSPRTPKTNKQWTLLDETREDSKDIVTLTIAGDDSKPTLIPRFGLKGCTARLGFQNGPLEQIDIDCQTMPPKQTGNGSSLNFPTTFAFPEMGNFSVTKQVSLALGVEQGNNSLLIASREVQFRDNYEQGYDYVNQLNQHPINDPNLLPDFVS